MRMVILLTSVCMLHAAVCSRVLAEEPRAPVKVGWVGPMTGPLAKWGSYQAALLAVEDLKARGGIGGRPLEVLFEDGQGQGREAASAAQKLINVDRVQYLIGGHCTPESLAIAPIAERAKAVMIAAVTSNPFLTTAGDYVFRVTAVSTTGAERVFRYAVDRKGWRKFAVIYEEADYPRPQAEKFRDLVVQNGLELAAFQSVARSETDFRPMLAKLRTAKIDAVYVATLSPDVAGILLKQLKELRLNFAVLGNENTGQAVDILGGDPAIYENIIFAASRYDPESPAAKAFAQRYCSRYHVQALPYRAYTAESYDALMLLAETIERCGDSPEAVKRCLYQTKDFDGASGRFSFDSNGDVVREYEVLMVQNGRVTPAP